MNFHSKQERIIFLTKKMFKLFNHNRISMQENVRCGTCNAKKICVIPSAY